MSDSVVTLCGNAAGWYGKLPGLGDFAARRLPPAFVGGWDDWLQRGLQHMRGSAGVSAADVDAAFASAVSAGALSPVRRFWLGAGVLDARAWTGLLMHSSDRAGRRFPLTVAQPMATLAQSLAARPWLSSVVAAMRFTLDNEHTLADFEACLGALPPPLARPAPRAEESLAGAVLQQHAGPGPCSAWWCHGAAHAQDFLVFAGLPPPSALATLLGGRR